MQDNFRFIERWTPETADAFILTAQGNPYGDPPDVGRYLRYAFGEKGLIETLKKATQKKLAKLYFLFDAKIEDGSLQGVNSEMLNLFTFSANKIAEKLTEITGEQWTPFEIREEELASLPS